MIYKGKLKDLSNGMRKVRSKVDPEKAEEIRKMLQFKRYARKVR